MFTTASQLGTASQSRFVKVVEPAPVVQPLLCGFDCVVAHDAVGPNLKQANGSGDKPEPPVIAQPR